MCRCTSQDTDYSQYLPDYRMGLYFLTIPSHDCLLPYNSSAFWTHCTYIHTAHASDSYDFNEYHHAITALFMTSAIRVLKMGQKTF